MDFEEMNQRAYDRKPEPDGLTPAERMIWLALRLLYELHFHGGLTREEGVAYKQELKKDYERNLAQEAEWLRAGTAMKLLRQSENVLTGQFQYHTSPPNSFNRVIGHCSHLSTNAS